MSEKRRRRSTECIARDDVEFMVARYRCLDSGALPALGRSCLEWSWLVKVGGGSTLDIKLTVDTHIVGQPEVSLMLGDQCIFPPLGSAEKAKLREDLRWHFPFRAQVTGIGELHRYEMRPEKDDGDLWYPATITRQREDGLFEVTARMPAAGEGPAKEVKFPAVRWESLRNAETKVTVAPKMRSLVLTVPCKDPKNSVLMVDSATSSTLITHFFARLTPSPTQELALAAIPEGRNERPRISFSVAKDRSTVACSVGPAVLEHFLNGEVRSCSSETSGHRVQWRLQIGPFALHVIEVERKYLLSTALTLTVDDEILCEALPEDLESPADMWECSFRFLGEKFLDFEVYEQTSAGSTLDSKGQVTKRIAYSHECVVSLPIADFHSARLLIDGKEFEELPGFREVHPEKKLVAAPEALQLSYQLEVPVKRVQQAPCCLNSVLSTMGMSCANDLFCCRNGARQALQHDTMFAPSRTDFDNPGIMEPKMIYPVLGEQDFDQDGRMQPLPLDDAAPGKAAPVANRLDPTSDGFIRKDFIRTPDIGPAEPSSKSPHRGKRKQDQTKCVKCTVQ